MSVTERIIKTTHGDIAVAETSGTGMPVLFIHGNSGSKDVFREILGGPIGESFRAIAMDLPGHGASSDAIDPKRTYSLSGFADAAIETLNVMGVERAAVVGWSLGGHVAIEMSTRYPGMTGMMLIGTPPVSATPESLQAGFMPNPIVGLIGKETFSDDDVTAFGRGTYGALYDDRLRGAIKRADGRLRRMTFEDLLAGNPADQRKAVEGSKVPVAFVNGADDPFVNLDYIGNLACANLWDRHNYVLRGAGHVPFLESPEAFAALLSRFLAEMAVRKKGPQTGKHGKVAAA